MHYFLSSFGIAGVKFSSTTKSVRWSVLEAPFPIARNIAVPRKPLNSDQSTPRKAAPCQPLHTTQDADDGSPTLSEVKDTNRKEHISKGRFNGF
jgi:hypothetical protein